MPVLQWTKLFSRMFSNEIKSTNRSQFLLHIAISLFQKKSEVILHDRYFSCCFSIVQLQWFRAKPCLHFNESKGEICAQACLASKVQFWVQIKPLYCPYSSDKGTNRVRVGWHFSWDQKCTSEAYLLISPTYCAFSCTAGQTIGIRLLGETNIGKVLQEDNSCAPARWHVGPDWKTQPHVQYGCEVLITSCRSAAVWLFSFLMQIQPSDTQNP